MLGFHPHASHANFAVIDGKRCILAHLIGNADHCARIAPRVIVIVLCARIAARRRYVEVKRRRLGPIMAYMRMQHVGDALQHRQQQDEADTNVPPYPMPSRKSSRSAEQIRFQPHPLRVCALSRCRCDI